MTVGAKFLPETYSALEQEKLAEFRSRISHLELTEDLNEDAHLIRWLRARSMDVEKAYEMLKVSLEWRKENKLEGILEREDVPDYMKKQTPFASLGLDKEGYPILLLPVGRQDGRAILEKYGIDECLRYNVINFEKVMALLRTLSEEQGRPVTQIVEIIDLDGYSYRQMTSKLCREFMIKMQTTFDANYPELLRYCLVINAPKIFYILFNILKPFIPKQTLEKVDIYGPDPEKWKKLIAEKFSTEIFPPNWGGTRSGSDKYCSQDGIWIQGAVDVGFFEPNKSKASDGDDEDNETLTKATISARDVLKIPLNIAVKGSSIAWRYRSHNHDIGFHILYQDGSEIVPYCRAQSQKHVQEGSYQCEKLGTYTAIFDNSYSYTRSKTIHYSVSVIEPEGQIDNSTSDESLKKKELENNNISVVTGTATAAV